MKASSVSQEAEFNTLKTPISKIQKCVYLKEDYYSGSSRQEIDTEQ